MVIEIHRPDLAALIDERMRTGAFHDIEDVLMQALMSSSSPEARVVNIPKRTPPAMGSALVEAMHASPCKDISLESASVRSPVRDLAF